MLFNLYTNFFFLIFMYILEFSSCMGNIYVCARVPFRSPFLLLLSL